MDETNEEPVEPPKPNAPFQFQIKHLLGLTAWVAGFCSCAMYGDVLLVLLYLIVSLVCVGICVRRLRVICLILAGLFLLMIWLPSLSVSREAPRRMQCVNHLKQIGVALYNYHDVNGCFPPAYIADESGKPIHSWRVLILPYIEQQTLYERYDFDEPWDGPNNSKLAKDCPDLFHCPTHQEASPGSPTRTDYVAVVGPDTAWPDDKSSRLNDFPDGTNSTIMVVEVADSRINWMEPRDIHIGQMAPSINPKSGQDISSHHPEGAFVMFADGSVRLLLIDFLDPRTLDALLTRSGGEKVDMEEIDP